MKNFLLLLLILNISIVFSQEKIKFDKGVRLIELKKAKNYSIPTSILFQFIDDGHLTNYYKKLDKQLKKRFRKTTTKIGVKYDFIFSEIFKNNVDKLPSNNEKREDYDFQCIITTSFAKVPNSWKTHRNVHLRKTQHYLNLKVFDKQENLLLTAKVDVHANYTIITQNKKVSTIIKKILINNLQPSTL